MEFIPFIFFTILTFMLWKKHERLDLCVYISGLYLFTSFGAMMLVNLGLLGESGILFDETDLELNFLPTVAYCVLLYLTMIPFQMIYKKDIKRITKKSPLLVDGLSWLLIAVSLLNFYLVADSTLDILSGDLEAVRVAHYKGLETPAQLKAETLPSIFGYLYYLNTATLLCLPLYFYYLCCDKKPWWFLTMVFFASLSMPLAGVQAADRTEMVFYTMMLIFCLILFHGLMSKKLKRKLKIASIPFLGIGLTYIIAVSEARFSDTNDGGAAASAFQYAGQGYVNYCYFWENANSDYLAAEREFPLIAHFLYKIDSNPDRRDDRSGKQGFFISVFPSFLGDLLLDLSSVGMVIWVIYYVLISMVIVRKSHRTEFDITEVLLIFLMAIVPIFGIFYYRYYNFYYTLMIMIAIMIYIASLHKIEIK